MGASLAWLLRFNTCPRVRPRMPEPPMRNEPWKLHVVVPVAVAELLLAPFLLQVANAFAFQIDSAKHLHSPIGIEPFNELLITDGQKMFKSEQR